MRLISSGYSTFSRELIRTSPHRYSQTKLKWDDPQLVRLREKPINYAYVDPFGSTALHLTAASGNVEILAKILEHVHVDSADCYGRTAIHEAVANGQGAVLIHLLEVAKVCLHVYEIFIVKLINLLTSMWISSCKSTYASSFRNK